MQFTRLRLSGFKSFVDPTELVIEPGMTGIVGPNGCGKSNLVEALRWVMGETSAKRMRGGEMDDVIFGGTATRPARNIAEVALGLDNTRKKAPLAFNDEDDLEVVRRIERESGSHYRVNGREMRARDVQLLFADAATGAHSTALVSQGRIGALINAKPAERRALLEEAAGIGGLHARRHEAELRLKAAETNLARLDDVIVTLQAQWDTLKKQARQAGRYRRLSEHIRRAEAVLLHLLWRDVVAAAGQAAERLRAAEREVGSLTERAVGSSRQREAALETLPPLRQAEAAAAAELQRLTLARQSLDEEEKRVLTARGAAEQRHLQLAQDRRREEELAADAAAALERLAAERQELTAAQADEAEAQRTAADAVREAAAEVAALDAGLARATEEVAAVEARRGALTRQIQEIGERRARLNARRADTERQRVALAGLSADAVALEAAAEAVAGAETRVEESRAAAEHAEQSLRAAQAAEQTAREKTQTADAERARLKAEAQGIAAVLAAGAAKAGTALLDSLEVAKGYEAALGAALGDDLAVSLDESAPSHWSTLPPYAPPPALPEGAEPLSDHVSGPTALARRLSQIAVAADAATALRLRGSLQPGQRLVTRDGGLWRWDGLTNAAGAPTAAAQRLQQRNRLAELAPQLERAEAALEEARAAQEAARQALIGKIENERAARQAMRDAVNSVSKARETETRLRQEQAATASKLAALIETLERIDADLAEAEGQREAAESAAAELPPGAEGRERVSALRARVAEKRSAQLQRQGEADRLSREATARQQRIASIALEERSWRGRVDGAARQLQALEERRATLAEEIETLARRPEEIAAQREALAETIDASTAKRNRAADALAESETRFAAVEKELKAAEAALGLAREERVRCQATVEQQEQSRAALLRRIYERLECAPEAVLESAGVPPDEAFPPVAEAESRLERLTRERDGMGPVNLMAETEAAELEARVTGLEAERSDLTQAIARLRQGIGALNREGRERLVAAFEKVNAHFERLFVRLFGGGRAHLKLDEGEDPLEAGLDIMASPPGKKLQSLSLLSGGEQALTALSLLFAVFLTNPAPICVLDEVDAPLDDSNVDRFCRLVEEIAEAAETRFLIITHHRITMARMDRLYGVTMGERGVSQLVSVDLQGAVRLRQTA